MNSKIFSIALIAVLSISLTAASGQYWTFAKATSINDYVSGTNVCHSSENPNFCKYYGQSLYGLKTSHKLTLVKVPQSINIYAPDGTCNITGIINTDGSCSIPSMVVSAADYNSLTMDPFVGAVPASQTFPTQAQPTTTFCQIANWIILNEDGYFANIVNETSLIDPPYCNGPPVPVPEFGMLDIITLGVAMAALAAVTTVKRFKI